MNFLQAKKRAFLGLLGGGSILPPGYTQLPYIESTGTQYIDTGFVPNENTRVVLNVLYTSTSSQRLFGCRVGSVTNGYNISSLSGSFYFDWDNQTYTGDSITTDKDYVIEIDKNQVYIDNVLETTFNVRTINNGLNALLLASNYNGTISETGNFKGYLYRCEMYDNGVQIRDYIPCINPNSIIGVYDIINGVFYQNAGTGDFIPGV